MLLDMVGGERLALDLVLADLRPDHRVVVWTAIKHLDAGLQNILTRNPIKLSRRKTSCRIRTDGKGRRATSVASLPEITSTTRVPLNRSRQRK